jgi:glucose-6-phosphate 1-dehydrogenase
MKTQFVIFGITGDLSKRKLLPALAAIAKSGKLKKTSIIGVSRRSIDIEALLNETFDDDEVSKDNLRERLSGLEMDVALPEDYTALKKHLWLDQKDSQVIFYLSVPPQASVPIVEKLGEAGINTANVKILLEKPFGVDLASAQENIGRDHAHFEESQLYRIDHYLAKEMAQNIMIFRRGNALFSQVWNNQFIESIDVIASEKIGIEGRAQFYEQTGALRDVLQGHLMQLASLILLDLPHEFSWDDAARLRTQALQEVSLADPAKSVRAQYDSYEKEVANSGSQTETFAAVTLSSNDPRWRDVPIHLITGKALAEKTTHITIRFKKQRDAQANTLTFNIQPHEGVSLELIAKKSGYERELETRQLHFDYTQNAQLPDAYEQVLLDAMTSNKNLFASSEEVLRSWEILQPIQHAWSMQHAELLSYPKGSTIASILEP